MEEIQNINRNNFDPRQQNIQPTQEMLNAYERTITRSNNECIGYDLSPRILLRRKILDSCQPDLATKECENDVKIHHMWKSVSDESSTAYSFKSGANISKQLEEFKNSLITKSKAAEELNISCDAKVQEHLLNRSCLNAFDNAIDASLENIYASSCSLNAFDESINKFVEYMNQDQSPFAPIRDLAARHAIARKYEGHLKAMTAVANRTYEDWIKKTQGKKAKQVSQAPSNQGTDQATRDTSSEKADSN